MHRLRWSAAELVVSLSIVVGIASISSAAEPVKTKTVKTGEISLTVPETWSQDQTRNRFRLAQFTVPSVDGDKEPAEFVVFYFEGGGGNIDDNIRRWINQFRSKDKALKITSGKSPQGDYVIVDLTGTWMKPIGPPIRQQTVETPNSRVLSAIVSVKDHGNYFIRLTGPKKTVTANVDAFRAAFGADAKSEKEHKLSDE